MGSNMSRLEQIVAELPETLRVDEAAAVIATEPGAVPAGYGLGCHGWVAFDLTHSENVSWDQIREWIRTSYMLVAPKRLARMVLAEESSIRGDAS